MNPVLPYDPPSLDSTEVVKAARALPVKSKLKFAVSGICLVVALFELTVFLIVYATNIQIENSIAVPYLNILRCILPFVAASVSLYAAWRLFRGESLLKNMLITGLGLVVMWNAVVAINEYVDYEYKRHRTGPQNKLL